MKLYIIIAALLFNLNLVHGESRITPPYHPTPEAPETVPGLTGDLIVAYALTQLDSADITINRDEGDGETSELDKISMPLRDLRGIDDLNEALGKYDLDYEAEDPEETLVVYATLSSKGRTVFSSKSSFKPEKVYENGISSLRQPEYAEWLNFQFEGIEIPVPRGVASAEIRSNTGELLENLKLVDGGFYLSESALEKLQSVKTLLSIVFWDGSRGLYDSSGHLLKEVDLELRIKNTTVQGILKVNPWHNFVDIQLGPEWGYNPSVEVQTPQGGNVELHIRSYNGYRPKYIHITTYDELAHQEKVIPVEYYDGIEIEFEPGENFLVWFEFPPAAINSGVGGKG